MLVEWKFGVTATTSWGRHCCLSKLLTQTPKLATQASLQHPGVPNERLTGVTASINFDIHHELSTISQLVSFPYSVQMILTGSRSDYNLDYQTDLTADLCVFSGSRSSKTFKPKKNIPEGSHQHDLMKHAAATLGSGNLRYTHSNKSSQLLQIWYSCHVYCVTGLQWCCQKERIWTSGWQSTP